MTDKSRLVVPEKKVRRSTLADPVETRTGIERSSSHSFWGA